MRFPSDGNMGPFITGITFSCFTEWDIHFDGDNNQMEIWDLIYIYIYMRFPPDGVHVCMRMCVCIHIFMGFAI